MSALYIYREIDLLTARYVSFSFLNDFTHVLDKKKVFLKIHIKRAYYEIPIAPQEVPKTTITAPKKCLSNFPEAYT